jgi:proteasome lid subunit RPN8/RPN11
VSVLPILHAEFIADEGKSAVMAGLKVIAVQTLPDGSLDLADLKAKAQRYKDRLAAFMVHPTFIAKPLSNKRNRSLIRLHLAYSKLVCKT